MDDFVIRTPKLAMAASGEIIPESKKIWQYLTSKISILELNLTVISIAHYF